MTTPQSKVDFTVKGLIGQTEREFHVTPCESHTGSAHGSFQISEMLDGKWTVHGYSLSCPSFDDARRIVEQSMSSKPLVTNTYSNRKSKHKEKAMAVKKKVAPKKSPAETVKELGQMAERHMTAGRGGKKPSTLVVVQAKDGRWVYGPEAEEKSLAAKAKGDYDSAADASEAASARGDIIINNGPPVSRSKKREGWGVGSKPSMPDTVKAIQDAAKAATRKPKEPKAEKASDPDAVALKKVCSEANVDPKLARRILRSKGQKPGGRWEWPKGEVAKIVALLKKEAAEFEKKGK